MPSGDLVEIQMVQIVTRYRLMPKNLQKKHRKKLDKGWLNRAKRLAGEVRTLSEPEIKIIEDRLRSEGKI